MWRRVCCVFAAFGDAFDTFGPGLEKELGDELGGDGLGCVFSVCSLHLELRLMSFAGRFDEFGRGFGTRAWR